VDDVEVQKAPAASRAHHRGRHLERIAEVRAGTRAEKVPYPIRIREARVRGIRMIGSGLLRVILGGPGTAGFESHAPDEHVKLIFPDPDGTLRVPEPDGLMLRWPRPMPTSREYTVRHYDAATGEIALDVALHPGGLGSDWAQAVEPGAVVHVAGPPGGLIVPHAFDRYLLAGDITALPAIARWLEELSRTAAGWASIEVADPSQEIGLSARGGGRGAVAAPRGGLAGVQRPARAGTPFRRGAAGRARPRVDRRRGGRAHAVAPVGPRRPGRAAGRRRRHRQLEAGRRRLRRGARGALEDVEVALRVEAVLPLLVQHRSQALRDRVAAGVGVPRPVDGLGLARELLLGQTLDHPPDGLHAVGAQGEHLVQARPGVAVPRDGGVGRHLVEGQAQGMPRCRVTENRPPHPDVGGEDQVPVMCSPEWLALDTSLMP
jgi:NADPH-dependent ferric siderophore reductase